MLLISRILLVLFMISVIFSAPFFTNGADQKDYIRFLPLSYPKIFTQTEASKKFGLYGDITDLAYQDVSPIDGIDDHRFKILQKIATRFAPYLVQNTAAVPMDFKLFMKGRMSFPLYIDKWDVSEERAKLIQSRTINFAALGFPCGPSEPEQSLLETERQITRELNLNTGFDNDDDCRLLSLVKEFRPDRPANKSFHTAKRPPRGEIFKVLYVDFPGHDEKSWRAEYEHEFSQRLPLSYQDFVKTYTHFFIHEDRSKSDSRAIYEFVIQYWFFYPFNDGGNNHEGDWEHINVVISPLNLVEELLNEDEIKNILQGEGISDSLSRGEQLVIKRVEYYFHYRVMILDYSRPNVYLPRNEWQKEVEETGIERLAEDWLWKRIRELAYRDAAETEINTHPISYIGGDNKGFDQLLAFPGGKNRDSHGNYPLPGLYQGVGPAGASEAITTNFDHRKHFEAAGLKKQKYRSSFGRGNVVEFDDPSRIELVPDWECVIDLLESNPEARREWSWLVLPIRWGYPAALSPFAGVVAHADTGNLAPLGPAFRDGWNLAGSSVGYELYWPHKFPSLFPLEWQDSYQNSLGFLNLTYPTLANLPPFDLLWRVAAAPFRAFIKKENSTFYKKETIPFRFMGLSGGVFVQTVPEEFVYLGFSPAQLDEILERLYQVDPQLEFVDTREVFIHDKAVGPILRVDFFMGKQFISENTLRHSRSNIGDDVSLTNRADPFKIRSELNMWEYAGSLRYNFITGNIQPFVKVGYGLSWYRLENITADGELLENPDTLWIRKPSFFPFKNLLPNTWHYGFGIEVIPYKSYADIPRGIDIGLRLEFVNFYHSVGLDFEPWLGDVAEKVGDVKVWRENINFVLTVSF